MTGSDWHRGPSVLFAVLLFTGASAALAAQGVPGRQGGAITLPAGWGQVEAEGSIAGLGARAETFSFIAAVQLGSVAPRTVRVVSGSVIQIGAIFTTSLADLQVGDHVRIWGFSQPDGTILAAHVLVLNRKAPPRPVARPVLVRGEIRGVVLAVREDTVTVLTDAGQVKEVLRAPTAKIVGAARAAGLQEFDIIRVEGTMLSDGNISATRITVEFSGAGGQRVGGRVTAVVPEASLVLLDDAVFVNIVPETYIVQGTVLRTVPELVVGQKVQIIGALGATPYVMRAQVVVITP